MIYNIYHVYGKFQFPNNYAQTLSKPSIGIDCNVKILLLFRFSCRNNVAIA